MSCGNCHRASQRQIFQRRDQISFWYYKRGFFFGKWSKEKWANLQLRLTRMYIIKKIKNPTPKQLKLLSFPLLQIWKEYPGVNLESWWRKACSLLHTSWKSHPWWERSGSQSDPLLFCLRLWFDVTVGLVTIPHMFPPLWLLQRLIHANLYSHIVIWIKDGSCRNMTWQKNVPGCFFPNTEEIITVVHGTPGWKNSKKDWTDFIGN